MEQNPCIPWILPQNAVHVWRVDLKQPETLVAACRNILNTSEQERADRFYWAADQAKYIISHAAVRGLLGAYLRVPPKILAFVPNPYGKPELSNLSAGSLHFNLSHSGDLGLIAISHGMVGVDVEQQRNRGNVIEMAQQVFAPSEYTVLQRLPDHEKLGAFFRLWVRKEAFTKALGLGLNLPLNRFEVDLTSPRLLSLNGESRLADGWHIHDLHIDSGYTAAVVWQGPRQVLPRALNSNQLRSLI